jgi:hypothetical protein
MMLTLIRTKVERMAQKHHRCLPIVLAPALLLLLVTTMSKYSGSETAVRRSLGVSVMPQVIMSTPIKCKRNAIVYFVEKHPSSTKDNEQNEHEHDHAHDSSSASTTFGPLTKSLDLLFDNYLLHDSHYESTSVFLFHTGDFGEDDLAALEFRYPLSTKGTLQLVNLVDSLYWTLPVSVMEDEVALELSDEQLLAAHKTRFFTTGVYDYLERTNHLYGCSYEHVLQLQESSFIYSKIEGDLFADMVTNNHMLQYRLCSSNSNGSPTPGSSDNSNSPLSQLYKDYSYTNSHVHTHLINNVASCAPSESFLVASLPYMKSRPVQRFLSFCEPRVYSKGLAQSTILAGIMYALDSKAHRLLDFTFGSLTTSSSTTSQMKCPTGTLQAGYKDVESDRTMSEFLHVYETRRHCGATMMEERVDLHVDSEFVLSTIVISEAEAPVDLLVTLVDRRLLGMGSTDYF